MIYTFLNRSFFGVLMDEKKRDISQIAESAERVKFGRAPLAGKKRSVVFIALALLFEALIFVVPVSFSVDEVGMPFRFKFLYNVFASDSFKPLGSIVFIAYLIPFLLTVLYAISHFRFLLQKNDAFNKNAGTVLYFCALVTFAFLVLGIYVSLFYKKSAYSDPVYTLSYLPFALSAALMLPESILNGKYRDVLNGSTRKGTKMRVVMLIFVLAATALAVFAVLSNIIVATSKSDSSQVLTVNGFEILNYYKSYDKSFQMIAYLLLGILVCVSLGALFTVLAFFRDSKTFKSVFMGSIALDFASVGALTALGVSYYVVQKSNIERLSTLFAQYGFTLDENWDFRTDTIYFFIGAILLIAVLFILKPYSKLTIEEEKARELTLAGGSGALKNASSEGGVSELGRAVSSAPGGAGSPSGASVGTAESPLRVETQSAKQSAIDQCPPFTFLDSKKPEFDALLEKRKAAAFPSLSLPALVTFVVDYAKNSRLRLSYSPEDIATFVAGLGISRLSILQGMSGTGKTSLPKIFAEAIFGTCDIIEVESSWKDKNELLGYYNEFSKTYTPKKFTQDLYKAKLNPEVVTFIVLDEMNLSRIEYYFSDFLSLMENEEDKREIKLVNIRIANCESGERVSYKMLKDDMTLPIPKNVWFVGTANRDESTFEISDKVYDRANTMNFTRRAKKITSFGEPMAPRFLDAGAFSRLLKEATERKQFDLSSYKPIAKAEEILSAYNLSFGNRIERQIENFVKIYSACFEGKDVVAEAAEKIYLSKVVAKLEFKTVENKEELAAEFEEIGLKKCAEFIRKLNEDI